MYIYLPWSFFATWLQDALFSYDMNVLSSILESNHPNLDTII